MRLERAPHQLTLLPRSRRQQSASCRQTFAGTERQNHAHTKLPAYRNAKSTWITSLVQYAHHVYGVRLTAVVTNQPGLTRDDGARGTWNTVSTPSAASKV